MSSIPKSSCNKRKVKGQKLACPAEDLSYMKDMGFNSCDLFNIYQARTLEQQIKELKNVLCKLNMNSCEVKDDFITIKFLFKLYSTVSTCALKNSLLRILSSLPRIENSEVQSAFVRQLKKMISAVEIEDAKILDISNLIIGMIDNGILKCVSFDDCRDEILNFIKKSLEESHKNLFENVSPSRKLTIISCIHNCIRCGLALFQKCFFDPSPSLFLLSKKLLLLEQFPSDTRATCGMFYALLYKRSQLDLDWNEFIIEAEEFGSIAQLSIFYGLLNILKTEELTLSISWDGTCSSLLEVIYKKSLAIGESDAADSGLILGVARCMQQITKSLISVPRILTESFLINILSYVWTHLEHFIDAVRHIANNVLSNVISIGQIEEGNQLIFEIITNEASRMPDEKRAKHIGLMALVRHVPVEELLRRSPELIKTLLNIAAKSVSFDHVASLYECLMKRHLKENVDQEVWLTLWIDPLLELIDTKRSTTLERILVTAVKACPDLIHYIIQCQTLDEPFQTHKNIMAVLICLRTSRKYSLLNFEEDHDNWKGLLPYVFLRKFICHSEFEIRLASFSLLVECQKSSECFIPREINFIKLALIYNTNSQSPADRQAFLGVVKKFLIRFTESKEALKKPTKIVKPDIESLKHTYLVSYREFQNWLIRFSMANLFPGANLSRRGFSLNLLNLCNEFGLWGTLDNFTKKNTNILVKCLLDPFEENKRLAIDLLSVMPLGKLFFDDSITPFGEVISAFGSYVVSYLNSSIKMASSVCPPDTITAAYFVRLLMYAPEYSTVISDHYSAEGLIENDLFNVVPGYISFSCVSLSLNQLKIELDIAKQSILKAASSAPMYGQLCVIRYILKELNYRKLHWNNTKWKDLILDIIETALQCNKVVAPIVNNSSPEGHLPMDFSYAENSSADQNKQISETPVTAQMVLLCSWRTVKEVSLLLGEIVEAIPISEQSIFLTEGHILEIGEHLMELMLETKHRGAFEQAYMGFCKLTGSLWKSFEESLHELPTKWLSHTLNLITTDENLSATRRSAGIPFIIQGLCCGELQVGSNKCLDSALKSLFQILNDPVSSVEARAHALNILRALFRHNMLGEKVGPYVAQALIVAINGFKANTWAERNASTLLMSTLMVRIFGVPRSKNEKINWKNKLTGKIFFQRYPQLYPILLKCLASVSSTSLCPAIYPVLLILGRLYPSPSESESYTQLNDFVPYIFECASSCISKTRSLAASAIVALTPPPMYVNYINRIFHEIADGVNENRVHGLLLQVVELLRHAPNLPQEYLRQINELIINWTSRVVFLLDNTTHSYVVKECCLKFIINNFVIFYEMISVNYSATIMRVLKQCLTEDIVLPVHKLIGLNGFLKHAAVTLFTLSYFAQCNETLYSQLYLCINYDNYDVFSSALEFISFIMSDEINYDPDLTNVDPICIAEDDFRGNLREYLINKTEINNILLDKLKQQNHHENLIKLLDATKKFTSIYRILRSENISVTNFFVKLCEGRDDVFGSYVLQLLSNYFYTERDNLELDKKEIDIVCKLLRTYSSPEKDIECRLAAANFLLWNFKYLCEIVSESNYLVVWNCYLLLNCDDESEVRDILFETFEREIPPSGLLVNLFESFCEGSRICSLTKAVGLITWILGKFSPDEDDSEDNERVFEKGEINTFKEDFLIGKVATVFLKQLIAHDSFVLHITLPIESVDFIITETSLNFKFSTLQDLICCFQHEVDTYCNGGKGPLIIHRSPFRAMEMRKLILDVKLDLLHELIITL